MERKEKTIPNLLFTFCLIVGLLLLMIQCDKFEEIQFISENNFLLNYSRQEFDVETKQKTFLNTISINGNLSAIAYPNILKKDTIVHFDGYSVRYTKDLIDNPSNNPSFNADQFFRPTEVIGEWFTIIKAYPSSTVIHILVDENNQKSNRELKIKIGLENTSGIITITQKSKY